MKCAHKTSLNRRIAAIIRGNKGASIVLVTIIAILIITGVIILRSTTSSLWASADKQLNQDQAYEMATSLGNSLDVIIQDPNQAIDLSSITDGIIVDTTSVTGLPDATIEARVSSSNGIYILTVESHVANATYVYTAEYTGSGGNYMRKY